MKPAKFIFVFLSAIFLFSFSNNLNAQCKGKDKVLESLGALTGMVCYDAYVSIGSISDGFEKNVYEADYIKQVMNEQTNALTQIDSTCIDLLNCGFITEQSDKDFLAQVRKTLSLLIAEANALINYSNGKSQADADEFQSYRNKAWKEISSMLGLGD